MHSYACIDIVEEGERYTYIYHEFMPGFFIRNHMNTEDAVCTKAGGEVAARGDGGQAGEGPDDARTLCGGRQRVVARGVLRTVIKVQFQNYIL